MKLVFLLIIVLPMNKLLNQVIINQDGTHSLDLGNGIVVNPDGTHSIKLSNSIVVNPDGTHSIVINPFSDMEEEEGAFVHKSQEKERVRKKEIELIELLKNNFISNNEFQLILNRLWLNDPLIDILLKKTKKYQKGKLSESNYIQIKNHIIDIIRHKKVD